MSVRVFVPSLPPPPRHPPPATPNSQTHLEAELSALIQAAVRTHVDDKFEVGVGVPFDDCHLSVCEPVQVP